jgi:hypothetical protein
MRIPVLLQLVAANGPRPAPAVAGDVQKGALFRASAESGDYELRHVLGGIGEPRTARSGMTRRLAFIAAKRLRAYHRRLTAKQ